MAQINKSTLGLHSPASRSSAGSFRFLPCSFRTCLCLSLTACLVLLAVTTDIFDGTFPPKSLLSIESKSSSAGIITKKEGITERQPVIPGHESGKPISYPRKWEFPASTLPDLTRISSKNGLAQSSGKGKHVCTCLNTDDANNYRTNQGPAKFRWLHIPKTGTSFISTLWSYATFSPNRQIDLLVSDFEWQRCAKCYDFALMGRYPLELYSPRMHLHQPFASLHTQHAPLGQFGAIDNSANVISFFRHPSARIVSGFDNGMHSNGIDLETLKALQKRCYNNVTCYATWPGSMGCVTRMLTGHTCAVVGNSTEAMVLQADTPKRDKVLERALKALKRMAFIGITEEWNESICRFHQKFGGVPQQNQFQNFHAGSKKTTVDDLPGNYHDHVDEIIYQAAVEEFHNRTMDLDSGESTTCYQFLPPGEGDNTQQQCVPKTCAEMGKQCGEWPDGCGGTRICGICNIKYRDGLPESWRFHCSLEGQCIRTCPPWEEAGLWYRPVDNDNARNKWQETLNGPPEHIVESVVSSSAPYLSPSDAVRMCVGACASGMHEAKVFAFKYCICARKPTSFLRVQNLTLADYQAAYEMKPALPVHKSKVYSAIIENATFTQPKCCPPLVTKVKSQMTENKKWQRGTQEAEFFAAYELGCGGQNECEALGHQHQASVVVIDSQHFLCYLGRNHSNQVLASSRYSLLLE